MIYDSLVSSFQEKGFSMLVLSRKKNDHIVIGNNIKVYIVDIKGETVRLGISAPDNVPIHRSEIYEAIKNEFSTGRRQIKRRSKPSL